MTTRATARGQARTSLEGTSVDVLICGASFAGLAVARELAGAGADVLLIDRYEIGERPTSACATPTPWLAAMGVSESSSQEIPHMRFTTPHGSVRYRLPWSWSSFDYRRLCELLYEQSDARFVTAKVEGRLGQRCPKHGEPIAVSTDRGVIHAALVVDALGWRRVLGARGYQPPAAPLSRGLEVHPPVEPSREPEPGPEPEPESESDPTADLADLDVWLERSLVRRGYGWCVPAGGEARVGVGSYAPAQHVRESTVQLAERLELEPVRYQGNWFPHRLRTGTEDGVFFAGDSAGHCFALSGEGIRTAFYFGIACGRELRAVVEQQRSREDALQRYRRFSAGHRRAFAVALGLQRVIPALPPRLLTFGLRAIDRRWVIDRAFGWYLNQAHPAFAESRPHMAGVGGPHARSGAGKRRRVSASGH